LKTQSIEKFEKEYSKLQHQEIFFIADENAYYKWLKEQYYIHNSVTNSEKNRQQSKKNHRSVH